MAKMRQINESGADLPCAIGVCAVQYCLTATVNVGDGVTNLMPLLPHYMRRGRMLASASPSTSLIGAVRLRSMVAALAAAFALRLQSRARCAQKARHPFPSAAGHWRSERSPTCLR